MPVQRTARDADQECSASESGLGEHDTGYLPGLVRPTAGRAAWRDVDWCAVVTVRATRSRDGLRLRRHRLRTESLQAPSYRGTTRLRDGREAGRRHIRAGKPARCARAGRPSSAGRSRRRSAAGCSCGHAGLVDDPDKAVVSLHEGQIVPELRVEDALERLGDRERRSGSSATIWRSSRRWVFLVRVRLTIVLRRDLHAHLGADVLGEGLAFQSSLEVVGQVLRAEPGVVGLELEEVAGRGDRARR